MLPLLPPSRQVWEIRVECGCAIATRAAGAKEIRSNVSIGEAADRLAVQSESTSNRAQGQPLRDQFVDLGMPLLVPHHQPAWQRRYRPNHWRGYQRRRRVGWRLLGFQLLSERCQDPDREALQRVAEVVRKMPAVRYLECTWRATSCSTGVYAITVTADDLGTRMFAEPLDERIRRGIFQQIDNTVSIHVHQNRAVTATAPKSKFVHPKDPYRRHW